MTMFSLMLIIIGALGGAGFALVKYSDYRAHHKKS